MQTRLIGLLAETSIHPGAGRNLGAIDLPVAREAATDYPVLVGSSLKGALRDKAEQRTWCDDDGVAFDAGRKDKLIDTLFGKADDAGKVLVSDGRLVLLPVRSLTGAYRWLTCPHILERFARDLERARHEVSFTVPAVDNGSVLTPGDGYLFLEERQFKVAGTAADDVVTALQALIHHATTRARLADQLAIVSDNDFAWFARFGLPVQARNVLDKNKTSTNLWYEESLPPDTVMSTLLATRTFHQGDAPFDVARHLTELLAEGWVQTGGNETVGQGWFRVCTWIAPATRGEEG